MKATGIVRRIDDLGRVVIPKEIRRTLRLREGTPLEIFTDREGEIILKKYSPMVELAAFAVQYAEAMAQSTGLMVCIADRDQIIAVSGGPKKEYYQKTISRALELAVSERQNICAARGEKAFIPITSDEVEDICVILELFVLLAVTCQATGNLEVVTNKDELVIKRERCYRGGYSPQPGGKAGAWRGGDEACSDGSRISGTSDGRIKKINEINLPGNRR